MHILPDMVTSLLVPYDPYRYRLTYYWQTDCGTGYVRSTCGQQRIAMCHVHKEDMDAVDVNELMRDFINARDVRAVVFEHV